MSINLPFKSTVLQAILLWFGGATTIFAQLSGTKYIPNDYATVASAVAALNAAGVGTGGVTFNVAANYTETITATISLNATGTAANPIVFQKNPATTGSNPLITAYTGGVGTPASAVQDGIWSLSGCNYVTINGIDVRDNPSNTTNPSTMEYGYALYKSSASNGCQFVTIQHCVITLNRINNAAGTAPMSDGSSGIIVMNATASAAATNLTAVAGGDNSNNKFYSNTIQNCNTGIALIGYADVSPFTNADTNNDVGGSSASTGNTIVNYGGAASATAPAVAVRTLAQYGLNVSYNTVNSNNGGGANHPFTLRGFLVGAATSAGSTITFNTITLKGGGTTQAVTGIENTSGSTAAGNTVSISNNTITNCTNTTATTGPMYGIYNNAAAPAALIVVNNTISNNASSASTTGLLYGVYNSGAAKTVSFTGNAFSGNSTAALTTGYFAGFYNSGAVANLSISGNTIAGNSTTSASGPFYAVINSGAVTATIAINSNNIGTSSLGAITFNAANSATQNFIYNRGGGATAALSISNNNIQGIAHAVAGTGKITFLANTAATLSQAINNNTFTSLSINTTTNVTFISNSVIVPAAGRQDVNYNSIVNSFSKTAAGGSVILFTSTVASASGSVINNNNNNFSNIAVTGATGISGWINTDAGSSNKTIQNNIFSSWTGGTSAITAMSVNVTGANNATTGNTISQISSAGSITGIVTGAGNDKIYSNIINALISTGTASTTVSGISATAGGTKNIYLNNIYNLQGNSITTGSVRGIIISGGTTVNCYQNTIYTLQANALSAGTLSGVWISGGTTITAYSNKIYDLSSSSNAISSAIVCGFQVSGSTANIAVTIQNNLIGDIRTTAASAPDPVRGMSVISTGLTSKINVYNNTIYLSAISSGANFGSTGIYHTTSPTATTATLDMRNNIIVNGSTPTGTGLTVAYRRSSSTLTNYGLASNNNLLYAGLAAPNRLLYYGGTNSDQFLSTYKTRVASRDAQSVTEDMVTTPKFISTAGASPNFLHIDSTKATQVESGGANITGLTTDFDGQIRQGNTGYAGVGTAPDIGADEVNGISVSSFSGTYTVGSGQTFTSLTNAGGLFAGINSRGLSGNVTVNITSDLTEDGTNVLYQYVEQGVGGYTLTIQPDAPALRTISGNAPAGLISLNGVKRVTINGSAGTTNNYLTFRNTNTAGTNGYGFIFINGASNNAIKYCNIEAYANAITGVVFFSASSVTGGNSNNSISNCNISATVSGNTGNVGVYSSGTAGNENSANTISNNNIYNYRDRGLDITASGSTGWTISGNSFYNGDVTGSINYSAGSTLHGIRISGGSGYTVSNNYLGGNAASAGGTSALYASTLGNVSFQGVLLTTTSATPASNIKGNTIANITLSSVPTAAGSTAFVGIESNGFGIRIGGTSSGEGNLVGSNASNGSISVTTTTVSTTYTTNIEGVNCNSSDGIVVGNQVGGIDIKNIGAAPAASAIIGINVTSSSAPSQVNSNIIGSTGTGAAANSIRVLSSSTAASSAVTGIFLSAAVTSTVQVNANIIQNISHLSAATSLTPGGLIGISNASGGSSAVSITNNTIASLSFSTYTTGLFYGVYNSGACTTLSITGNTINGNSTAAATGVYYAIFNAGAVTTSVNINSNNIGNNATGAFTFNAANSGTQILINNTAGAATAALSVSNNNFQGVAYAAQGSGSVTFISNTAATLSQAINGNTFSSLSINTTGSAAFITNSVVVSSAGTQNVNNNSIVASFSKLGAGGTLTLFNSVAASSSGSVINNNSNNFSNITVTGATIIAGWVNTDAGSSTKNIQNNTFSSWTGGTGSITIMTVNISGSGNAISGNIINTIAGAGAVTGISTSAGNNNIYLNVINTLSTTGPSAVTAISVSSGTTENIYKNKIYDLSGSASASSVNGILIAGGTLAYVYNNLIGDLRTPAANSTTDLIRGISITSSAASTSINLFYNTIYLNASSTGTNFSSTGVYHAVSAASTTATLSLINNCIMNTSTPKGSGLTVAFRRSGTTLNNYSSSSNNNLLYAGTPGASRLIFYDGTNSDQTLTNYKSRVSTRDAQSVTEDETSKFLSATGSSPLFLHVSSSVSTLIESGGTNIAGFTDDFDGQTRAGNPGYTGSSGSPDIGADEIFGIETVPPAISYTPLSNTTSTANRSLTGVTITDASGVNVSTGTKPRIYYKRFSDSNVWLDNSPNTNGWKYTEATNGASPFSFTINYSILFGGTAGTAGTAGVVQYFITAQDVATVANVAINSGAFAATPSSVALTSAAFPIAGTINSYTIPYSGMYKVGATEIFTSFTKADGLFASINSAGLSGNVTLSVTSDLSEDGANALNQWAESGEGNYTLMIKPDAKIVRNITGNAAGGLIILNGSDRLTIDGSSSGSGIYLSFKNTNTAGSTGTAFTFQNGATNNTLKYIDAAAYANGTNGVILFGASSVAGGNSSNTIDNCTVNAEVASNTGSAGIYSAGSSGNENSSNTISNNTIYGYKDRGLDVASIGSTAWTISGNSFYNGSVAGGVNYAASSALHGIRILGGSGYNILNNYIGGSSAQATGSNAVYTSTLGNLSYQGILLTTSAESPVSSIKGNIISGISLSSAPSSAGSNAFIGIETNGSGINIGGSGAGDGNTIGSNSANASIEITTTTTSSANTSMIAGINCQSSGGLAIGNQVGGIDINNIGSAPAASVFSGILAGNATPPSQINNNIIGSAGTNAIGASIRVLSSSSAPAIIINGIVIGSAAASAVQVDGNTIQNFNNLSTVSSGSFTGINNGAVSSEASITITNNNIKYINAAANSSPNSGVYTGISSTSPSAISNNSIDQLIYNASGSSAQIRGIAVSGAFIYSISGNTISNLSTASPKSADIESDDPAQFNITGVLNSATVSGQTVAGNILYNFNGTAMSAVNTAIGGIAVSGAGSSGNVFGNRMAAFSNKATGTSTLPGISGITAFKGSYNMYNNAIKLYNGGNVNGVKIYGINHSSTDACNYYYNTASIVGSGTSTAARSAAFIRTVNGSVVLRDNIFSNTRTGSGSNYAVSNLASPATSNWTSSTSNYNDLYSANANTLGEWGSGVNQTFSQWKSSSSGDASTVNNSVSFLTSVYDLQPDSVSNCVINGAGTPVATPITISADVKNVSRNADAPDLGAYEFNYTGFNISSANSSPVCAGDSVDLSANTGNALNPTYSWKSASNSIVSADQNPTVLASAGWYKIVATDANGCSTADSTLVSLNPRPTASLSGAAAICAGSSATINLSLTGSGLLTGILTSGDSINGSAPAISIVVTPASTTYYSVGILSDANCSSSIPADAPDTAAIVVTQTGGWLGTNGSAWNDAANWCGGVPGAATNVVVESGITSYPVVTSGTNPCYNISIDSGATLTVNGATLQIKGAIVNNGTLDASAGTIEMNGTSAQTIPARAFSGNAVKNLTINNLSGVSLAGTLNLSGILLAANGQFNTAGYLTLLSSSSQTALIDGSGGGGVTGNVTMQRYLAAGHGYKYISSPFQAATVGGASGVVDLTAAFPNFYQYIENQATSGFSSYTASTNLLNPLQGYAADFGSSASAKTISLTGVVNNGSLSATLYNHNQYYTQGFNLVGNPYPSPVDWNASSGWTKTNIDNAVYFFDSGSASQYTGTYSAYINGVSSDGVAGNIIASMQGFFVHVSAGSYPVTGVLGSANSVRVTNLSPYFHKSTLSVLGPAPALLRLSANFSNNPLASDPLVIYMDDRAKASFNRELDAMKLMNTSDQVPNIYLPGPDSLRLAVKSFQKIDTLTVIPVGVSIQKDGEVTFRLRDLEQWPEGLPVYFVDAVTGAFQDLRQNPIYTAGLKQGAYESRFSLRCGGSSALSKSGINGDAYYIFRSNGAAYVHVGLMKEKKGVLTVTDALGRRILEKEINGNGDFELQTGMVGAGIYIASFITADGVYAKKYFW